MKRRLSGLEKNVPYHLGSKKNIRNFCDLIGINTTKVLQLDTLDNINLDSLPEYFVIKPTFASTSIGVYLLQRSDDGFINLLTHKKYFWDDIIAIYSGVIKIYFPEGNPQATFIIEELLFGQNNELPPQDIRFYAFQGELGMILKEDHMSSGTVKAMYFDHDFLPMSDVHSKYGVADGATSLETIVDAVVPDNWKELLNIAKRVSISIPTAFARIDLYDTPNGVYLGEVTLTPGTFYYHNRKLMSNSESYRLGRLWLEAEQRMKGTKGY